MKRLQTVLISCLSIFLGTTNVFGQEITVVTEEFPPFNYTNSETGEKTGLSTDIVKALLKEVGVNAEIKILPWARALHIAEVEKNVLIFSLKRKADRENKFKWVGELVKSKVYLIALKESPIAPSKTLDDFKPYITGAVRDGANAQQLVSDGFKRVFLTSDRDSNWTLLKNNRIDLWCTDIISANHIAKSRGDAPSLLKPVYPYEPLSQDGLYLAFSLPTDEALVEKFRAGLKRLKDNGTYTNILKRYSAE